MGHALHRQLAWLALCAVIFGAFAPSISKLAAAAQGIAWIEICSTNGSTKLVALDLGTKKTPDAPAAMDKHCGYCLLQQHAPVIPTPAYTVKLASISSDRIPIGGGGSSVFKRFIREANQTRAPPELS